MLIDHQIIGTGGMPGKILIKIRISMWGSPGPALIKGDVEPVSIARKCESGISEIDGFLNFLLWPCISWLNVCFFFQIPVLTPIETSCKNPPAWRVFACAPTGTRTPVLALRGLCPRPLDDGGKARIILTRSLKPVNEWNNYSLKLKRDLY